MKRVLSLGACLLFLSVAVWAQSDADYQGWMKSVGPAGMSLRKNLEAKSGDAAAADAKNLADIFAKVHDYWQKKNVEDAVKFSADAESGFKNVSELAAAGKFDEATAALKTTQANCGGCHMAHREKAADGTYSIK